MFQADCRAKGVQMTVEMGTSVQALGQRRLLKGELQVSLDSSILTYTVRSADPSRLAQTTVNLISNSLKFIVKSETRRVRVCIDISLDKPGDSDPILPPSEPSEVPEAGSPVYLYIAVVSKLCRTA
jgi:signal transduction histidine kinase